MTRSIAGREKQQQFVGRAEQKLLDAVDAFWFNFCGKIVLDIGSSTGGFTELALNRGAKKVVAVEKGTNQMKAPLRFDARIDLREKTDIFDVDLTGEGVEVVLADVSFISLKKVLAYIGPQIDAKTDFLVMVKPQFEAKPGQLVRGVVKNERMRREILKEFEGWLKKNGFIVKMKRDNQLTGKNGNLERFYWLRKNKLAKTNKKGA